MAQRTVITHLRAVGPGELRRDGLSSATGAERPSRTVSGREGTPRGRLLLTVDEAANLLGIGRTSLYRLVWAGRLTPVRIGRSVRFSCAQLELFVSSLEDAAR